MPIIIHGSNIDVNRLLPNSTVEDADKVLKVGGDGKAMWSDPPQTGTKVRICKWEETD